MILLFTTIMSACVSRNVDPIKELPPKQTDIQPKEVNPSALLLDEIRIEAQNGMVLHSPYNVMESSISQVKAEWGEPDKVDQAGSGYYATYNQKEIVFGFNEDGDIFDIRSYDKNLNGITLEMIEQSFGSPVEIRENYNEKIYVYGLNQKNELKWIIPNDIKVVDHISVFNPHRVETEQYVLDIKGKSNQLTNKAREAMMDWRKQIVSFSKKA